MKSIEEILHNFDLSENEVRLFIGALKAGLAPISQVAGRAGIARTYAYEIAERLKEKGLVAEVEERGVRKIQALDYTGLLAYISRKQRDMERLEKDLIKAAAEFQSLRSGMPQKTKVRFFEGVEGIKNINAEIRKDVEKLQRPYQFYVVFSADRMETVLPGWIENNDHIYYPPFMKKYGIISQTFLLPKFIQQVQSQNQKNFHYKLWPAGKREFSTDTLCWLNKIAYLDMNESPSGIIIENSSIVQTFVMWFEQMWNSLR